jgi:predicted KAP-like P-loop ATPase
MIDKSNSHNPLASDAPVSTPEQDAFGYAPFASRLAAAIATTPSPEGLIMAINGAWGSGKSTLLNFVKHDLTKLPLESRPVIIDFNPWWFDDYKTLAGQFIAQFASKLPQESEALRKIGDAIADYAESVGTLVANATGFSFLKGPTSYLAKLLHRKVKDVPALKAQIAQGLKEAGQRFVFVIDDIDRLDAQQIREVFKVLKALANFPNVIYLLAFDRHSVTSALTAGLGMDGEAYLEKIVQAPFSLPTIDRARLANKLFADIQQILNTSPSSPGDAKYWGNAYHSALHIYVNKPRDLVRIVNALSVTYPAVAGEVNFVDFISLEFLRLFEPDLYASIRDNPHYFTGLRSDRRSEKTDPERTFHEAWLARVAEPRRASTQALAKLLFPRLNMIWGNTGYTEEFIKEWRRQLRACAPESFSTYFRFGVAEDALSRRELNELLASAENLATCSETLLRASRISRTNGSAKVREYIERLTDLKDELTPTAAKGLLDTILDVGDSLFNRVEVMDFYPNRWRMTALINHLLKRIEAVQRAPILMELLRQAKALSLSVGLIESIRHYKEKPQEAPDAPFTQFTDDELAAFKLIVVQNLRGRPDSDIAGLPELDLVTDRWRVWDDLAYVTERMSALLASDEYLPMVLEGFLRLGTSHSIEDSVATVHARLNPKHLERFTDIKLLESRVVETLERSDLTGTQREAGKAYLEAMSLIRKGKDPGGLFVGSDD